MFYGWWRERAALPSGGREEEEDFLLWPNSMSVSCCVFSFPHTLLPTAALVCHIFPSHNVFLFKWEVNIDKSHLRETFVGAGQSSTLTPRILSPDWTSNESLLPVDLFSSHKVQVLWHMCPRFWTRLRRQLRDLIHRVARKHSKDH